METTDRDESHEQIKRRTKRRMVLAMLSTLAAAVAAPFVVEAVDADLMSVIAVVAVASVLVSGWLVLKATRSTSTEEVDRHWLDHTALWVYSVVGIGLAGIAALFVGDVAEGLSSWTVLIYSAPMAAVSWALRRRLDELVDE